MMESYENGQEGKTGEKVIYNATPGLPTWNPTVVLTRPVLYMLSFAEQAGSGAVMLVCSSPLVKSFK
jgi:hypothetical protein